MGESRVQSVAFLLESMEGAYQQYMNLDTVDNTNGTMWPSLSQLQGWVKWGQTASP